MLAYSLNLSGFNFFIRFEELEINEEIGKGGFGKVYSGQWNGKNVAIKKLNVKFNQNYCKKNHIETFIKEVNFVSNLRHPNVILYMGVSAFNGEFYMLSEHMARGSLFDNLHVKKVTFTDKEKLNIVYELALAMQYLHSKKIYHCDLKSGNVLLDNKNCVKLNDFGLSKIKHLVRSDPKGKVGTPNWMAPEILKEEEFSAKSDVYSFGMVVYELIAEQIPYYMLSTSQIIAVVSQQKNIIELTNEGPLSLHIVFKYCTRFDPSQRPTFESIIKYLENVIAKTNNYGFVLTRLRFGGDSEFRFLENDWLIEIKCVLISK